MRISKGLLFGLSLLLFSLLISIPNSYSESELYENQEYGFTIEFPSEWILNDTIPQKNKWIEIVSFLPDTEDWSQGIYVNKWNGDLKDKNFDSNEYLEDHNKAAQDWCSSLSISENGFACMNYSLIEQKTVSISGRESFLLEETWTRVEVETSSEVLVYNLQIPDGEDRWTIIAESRREIIDETSNILKNSLNSFILLKELQNSTGVEVSTDSSIPSLDKWNLGKVYWLEASYPATGTAVVRVIDPDMNFDPKSVDNFDIDVWSDSDAAGVDLTVTETNDATGIFEGTIFFSTSDDSSGHRLRVTEGDTITAEYEDNTLPGPSTIAEQLDIVGTAMIQKIPPPKQQVKNNVESTDISCNTGLVLIFKASDNSPACVKPSTVQKLVERGWANQ